MMPFAYLMMDGDRVAPQDVSIAFLVCFGLSVLWLVFALAGKRKGKPLELPYGFWCLAGPGWIGLTGLLIYLFESRVASVIILLLAVGFPVFLVMKKFRPNQRPDGAPAKSPPSNPGQVSGVPHP